MFFDDAPNKLCGLCGTKWTKNCATMKNRRTEKTVRRSFIKMRNTSKFAVKRRKQRKKHRKIGVFLIFLKIEMC